MSTVQSLVDPKCKERLARQQMKYDQEIDKLKKNLKELLGKDDSELDEVLEPKPPKKPPPALLKKPHHMQRFVYPADRENIPQSEIRHDAPAPTQKQIQIGWQKVKFQAPTEMPPLEDLSACDWEESTGARNNLYNWFYNRLFDFNCVFFFSSSSKTYWCISNGIYRSIR